ncbi:MAG TPA: LPS assembly lipoprotein LptE [Dongiaceae bacterium]|nr:LPS assembly lipoprotein LptE [Dongiaceae bacterium]
MLLAGASASLGASLAGCGFHPMYGKANTDTAGTPVDYQMAGIRIQPIANREGQQLHNALRDRFNPLGQPSAGAYDLAVNLTVRSYGALAKRDLSASRRNVELNAFYNLRDTGGKVVMSDRAVITTGYDEFDDPLNDLSAYEDTLRRGTLQLADQIRSRVAVFLTAGTTPAVVPAASPAPEKPGAWAEP